jgi:hypothetical protein
MGRELRRVSENWKHPKDDNNNWHPMFNKYYGDALNDWMIQHKQWEDGIHPDLIRDPKLKLKYPFYSQWGGNAPDVEYYQTEKYTEEELTHIQLYETTSEGTPISPVFKSDELDKLCEFAAENCTTFADFKATKEEWLKMLSDDFVCVKLGNVTFI